MQRRDGSLRVAGGAHVKSTLAFPQRKPIYLSIYLLRYIKTHTGAAAGRLANSIDGSMGMWRVGATFNAGRQGECGPELQTRLLSCAVPGVNRRELERLVRNGPAAPNASGKSAPQAALQPGEGRERVLQVGLVCGGRRCQHRSRTSARASRSSARCAAARMAASDRPDTEAACGVVAALAARPVPALRPPGVCARTLPGCGTLPGGDTPPAVWRRAAAAAQAACGGEGERTPPAPKPRRGHDVVPLRGTSITYPSKAIL